MARGATGRRKARWREVRGRVVPVVYEEDIVKEIRFRLWYGGLRVYRVRERIPGAGGIPSEAGIPDLIGYIPEIRSLDGLRMRTCVPLYIEVKRPGGAHRKAQQEFISEAQKNGCVAFFADSWAVVRGNLAAVGINLPD